MRQRPIELTNAFGGLLRGSRSPWHLTAASGHKQPISPLSPHVGSWG